MQIHSFCTICLVNGKVSEQEFVSFDRWLPVIVNGKGQNRKIALKTLRSLTAHGGSEFASLDMNQDGYVDERGNQSLAELLA